MGRGGCGAVVLAPRHGSWESDAGLRRPDAAVPRFLEGWTRAPHEMGSAASHGGRGRASMTAEPSTRRGERRHAREHARAVLLVRAYELLLAGVAIVWTALPKRGSAVAVLAVWDTLAGGYLVGVWLALRR